MRTKLKWALALVFLFAGVAEAATEAATYTLPNGALPNNCSSSGQTVTCSSLNLNWNDKIIIQGNSHVTLKINGDADFNNAQVNVGGGTNKLTIDVSKNFNLAYQGSVIGTVEAEEASLGGQANIQGSLTIEKAITAGSNVIIVGDINAEEIKVGSDSQLTGTIVVSNKAEFGSRNVINGNISAEEIKVGSDSQLTGAIVVSKKAEFGSRNVINGNISAEEIKVGSDSTINGHLNSAKKTTIDASTQIIGNIVAKEFELNSHSNVQGDIFVSGDVDIKAHNSITGDIIGHDVDIGSSSSVEGDVSGYKVELSSSNVSVDGHVTATTEIDIGSGSSISGDATADTIINNGGNSDSAVAGDIYCNSRTNFVRQCQPLSGSGPGGSGTFGIASCSADFSTMLGYGVIGDANFEYNDKAKINTIEITGSNGNTPTPQGVVDTVPTSFPALNPANFPAFSTGSTTKTNESNIPPGSYDKIESTNNSTSTQGGTYYINEVEVGENNKLHLAAGQYYINTLKLNERAKLTLGGGDYFIKTLEMDENAEIIIESGASVRIYIKDNFNDGDGENAKINHSNGSVASLSIFLYSGAELELGEKSKFTGFIYSPFSNTKIVLHEKVHYEGGIISAGDVELDEKVKITFDEVDTYEEILEAAGCNAVPPEPDVHHYRIVLPQQELVSCYAVPVTVKACANADCSSIYANTVEGTLESDDDDAAWNGTNSNSAAFTFATGESTYGLSLVPGGSTTISLNNLVPVAGNATQCVDASGAATSCDILFKTAGLLVSAASPTAGVDTLVTVRAVETNTTGACMARATGTQSVRLGMECSNPGSCAVGQSFTANGQLLSMYNNTGNADNFYNSIASTSVSLSFDSSGTATFNANYTDVGHIRIHAALDLGEAPNAGVPDIDDPDVTLSGTGSYVVRPHSLVVIPLNDDGTEWTDTNDAYKAAGELFKVAIQSFNADVAITPNFGNEIETPKGSVAFHSVAFPTNGYGDQSDLDVSALSLSTQQNLLGALVYEGAIWNEAGTVNLTAVLEELYLNAGDAANKPASPIGRFYPHHFVVDDSTSIVRNSCTSSNYTYMGQPEIDIELKLLAVNTSGKIVRNYGRNNYAGSAVVEAFALDTSNVNRLVANLNADWLNGELINLVSDANFVRLANNNPDGPFDNVKVHLAILSENDGRDFLNSSEEIPNGTLHLKYGRMVLENIYGPEDVQLNVQLNTEYWDGERFALHSADNCTTFENDNSNPAVGLNVVSDPASLSPVSSGLTSGTLVEGAVAPGDLYWLPPSGVDPRGEFDFEYNAPEWLRFDWGRVGDLNGTNQNPQATAGFGVYRGNDRIIFSLERNF